MRRHGENIRERVDGRWEARVVQGRPVARKTNYKYLYGRSYEDVLQKKKGFLLILSLPSEESEHPEKALVRGPDRREPLPEGRPVLEDVETSPTKPQEVTVSEVTLDLLKQKKSSLKESTYAYYTVMVNNHVIPGIGEIPVHALTSEIISDFLINRKKCGRVKDGKPLFNKTVSDLKVIVKQILSYEQERGLILCGDN